jgi:hypothetical protein
MGRLFASPPVFTGDDFTLDWRFGQLSPGFTGDGCNVGFIGPRTICNFDIAWSASPSGLTVSIYLLTASIAQIGNGPGPFESFGPFGGPIASDFEFGGCIDTSCRVTGFWQSAVGIRADVRNPAPLGTVGRVHDEPPSKPIGIN